MAFQPRGGVVVGKAARTAVDAAFEVVYDDELLRISHSGNDAAPHVVAFTGIGMGLQGIQTEEFRKTIDSGPNYQATYVIDKTRSWYNATYDDIRKQLAPLCATSPRVTTLGNSMGGYGAFYCAGSIPNCDRAIAFAPQFSVHPDLFPPTDTRWAEHRERITHHRRRHALEHPSPDIDYIAFFGDGSGRELEHARRLAGVATGRTHIFIVKNCEHDVAATVKRALVPD